MEEFVEKTSIHGMEFFESKDKWTRRSGKFVFFIAFCGLGFYIHGIFVKWRIEPFVTDEVNQVLAYNYPFPAVTICNPIFSRDQNPNLHEVLKNPGKNLTLDEQKKLAANVQACAPQLGSELSKIYPNIDANETVKILSKKFLNINDSFALCALHLKHTDCNRLINSVLTDYGFCFSYNLQAFNFIFNLKTISSDFRSYRRTKIAKYYSQSYGTFKTYHKVNDDLEIEKWTMEDGYTYDFPDDQPLRSYKYNSFVIYPYLNKTDLKNICPQFGKSFSIIFHMPNEIATPFHATRNIDIDSMSIFRFELKSTRTDKELARYSPQKRGCYFKGEKNLKFFRIYTKAQCEFECLANETLKKCGCVKFSMPRTNSTQICGLDKTLCYLNVKKNYLQKGSPCNCLHPCFYIDYVVESIDKTKEFSDPTSSKYTSNASSLYTKINIIKLHPYLEESTKVSIYTTNDAFADFGSILGVFFGCSFLSIFEVFHFIAAKFFQIKSKISAIANTNIPEETDFVKESTFHGIKFIFDTNYKDIIRIFWFLAFLCSTYVCILSTHKNYLQWRVNPETEKVIDFRPSNEIPFPAVTICHKVYAKHGLANYSKFFVESRKGAVNISKEEAKFLIANMHRFSPNLIPKIKTKTNFSEEFDVVDYLNRSEYEIEELIEDCKLGENSINCAKVFRRVLTHLGICFAFNQENFHTIFNDEISHDFDFYGRAIHETTQWTLDKGYQRNENKKSSPLRMEKSNEIAFSLKVLKNDLSNLFESQNNFYVFFNKPNEVLSVHAKPYYVKFGQELSLTLTAKVTTYDQEFRRFTPEKRDCFFTNERKLKYIKSFTHSNCFEECLANETLNFCNCTKFSMPRDDQTPVCILNNNKCYYHLTRRFPSSENTCGCLRTCNDIKYVIEKEEKILEKSKNESRNKSSDFLITRLHVQFIGTLIEEEKNFVLYGFKDFLNDVGGTLGLYLGISLMSIAEIFYFPMMAFIEWLKEHKKRREQKVSKSRSIENKEESFEIFPQCQDELRRYFGKQLNYRDLNVEDLEKEENLPLFPYLP